MTKRELIEALEALDCDDATEVRAEAGWSIYTVVARKIEGTGIISHIEVS